MPVQKQAAAAAVTVVNIAVAVTVNVLTSGWSWLIFVVLAVLSSAWVGLEFWRTAPKRTTPLGPPVIPGMTGMFVPRPGPTSQILRALLAGGARKVGITTALTGAGGFGKTTLATAVCELPEIKKAFPATYWVTVGQEVRGAGLADAINDVIEHISGQPSGITSPEQAGLKLSGLLKDEGPSLLVVDDVWTAEQLRPFLNAGRGCTLLVTTRIPALLADHTGVEPVRVDQMSHAEARQLLTGGVPGLPEAVGEQLLEITGRWPIALRLANASLRRTDRDGGDVAKSAGHLLHNLRELGPAALDVTDAARRDRTVAATLESSLGVLGARRERVLELAIFPEDSEIPVDLVVLLWQASADLSSDDGELLCQELAELSLVTRHGDRLRLHDVIRAYLQHKCGRPRLRQLHDVLLNAVSTRLLNHTTRPVPWWTLPHSAKYLWRSLAYHLQEAGRLEEVATLVTAPRWVISKLRRFGPVAVVEDLAFVNTGSAMELSRFLDQLGHLLVPGNPEHAVVNALAQRLPPSSALDDLRQAATADVAAVPHLIPERPLPDRPDPALNRVLGGHEDEVVACAFSRNGHWLVSVSDGLRVWHPDSGQLVRLLPGGLPDAVALSPDGHLLACEGDGGTIRVLDTSTWEVLHTLEGHRGWVRCCCFSTDGETIVSVGSDDTIRVWESQTGKQLRSIKTPETIRSCTSLRDGRLLSIDDAVRIWDLGTDERVDLSKIDAFLSDVAVSPDERWAAVAGHSALSIYDLTRVNEPPRTLHYNSDLTAAAFSSNGEVLATGSETGLIVLWSTIGWRPIGQIAAHGSNVMDLAFSPNGTVLASASADRTVRLWDLDQVRAGGRRDKLASGAEACVVAPDRTWLAVRNGTDSVTIHDPTTGATREALPTSGNVYGIASVGNGALSVKKYNEVAICEADNWHISRSLSLPDASFPARLFGGGGLVCVANFENRIVLWDTEGWQPPVFLVVDETSLRVHREAPPTPNPVTRRIRRNRGLFRTSTHVAIAPTGGWLAVCVDKAVHVVKPRTWEQVTTLRLSTKIDKAVAAPDGRRLTIRLDDTIQYWNSDTWTLDAEYTDHHETKDWAWSPDGSRLATVSADRTLRVHDSSDWTVRTEMRLDGKLNGCAWLSNHRLVAVGGHGVYWFTYVPG